MHVNLQNHKASFLSRKVIILDVAKRHLDYLINGNIFFEDGKKVKIAQIHEDRLKWFLTWCLYVRPTRAYDIMPSLVGTRYLI